LTTLIKQGEEQATEIALEESDFYFLLIMIPEIISFNALVVLVLVFSVYSDM
jgi:hypothetical protein